MSKNITYDGMLVYADLDKTQCELQIAINHGLRVNRTEDMILLEGKVPSEKELMNYVDEKIVNLFKEIQEERYFIMMTPAWTEELQSEGYIERLKEKRKQ